MVNATEPVLLPVGAQLTLYTDGVVEARMHSGELLGFERAAALSVKPAGFIAETAQSFGQDDDITYGTRRNPTVRPVPCGLYW